MFYLRNNGARQTAKLLPGGEMDVTKILTELRQEREQIEEAIMSLERLARGRGRRRGRPPAWMTELDKKTGKSRVRVINVANPSYKIAREYMIRLEKEDLEDAEKLRLLAQAASSPSHVCTPEEFRSRFQHLVSNES